MTPEQVRIIVSEELQKKLAPMSDLYISQKKACQFLKCSDKWLRTNKSKFQFRRKNRRGDLEYQLQSLINNNNQN